MIPNHGRVKIPEDELKIIKMKISILSGINIYPHGNYFMDKNKNLIRVYSSKNYFRQFVCLDNKYGSVVWIINNFKFLKKIVYFGNVSLH
jgi:hypothetical protein